jgi:hypothetical protein
MSAGYPSPVSNFPSGYATRPPAAGTAETLVLVALILQVIGAALPIVAIAALVGLAIFNPFPYIGGVIVLVAAVGALALLFLYFAYEFSYQRIRRGEYGAAQAPTLVFGIISLFLGVIPGILYLIAYVKLGDAVRDARTGPYLPRPEAGYGPAFPPAPGAQQACGKCGRVYPVGQFAFCPRCGQALAA